MKKNRIKVTLPTINSRDEAEALVGELQLATLHQIKLTAKMDTELAAVRQKYEGNLSVISEDIKVKTDTLRAWAEANAEEFGKRKSIEFVHGIIGFRTGTPKLTLLNRSWNWQKVLETLRTLWAPFIRTKEEVDKDAILGAYSADEVSAADLAKLGVKVVQEENFYVEPKITEVETRQIAEATA